MNETVEQLRDQLDSERVARIEAERAGRLKDEFLEALAHELRAPLNAILGWSRLMELGRIDASEVASGGQTIARNARQLATLVDDLLDLSSVVNGRIRVDPEEVDVCEIAEAALDMLEPLALDRGVQLRKDFASGAGPVFGDPHRLQQVVWHLLSNAIKFTPRGGLALIVVKFDAAHCELTVTDTGTGIPAELLPFVFDRFWRADPSSEQRSAGLGLGLALTKRLVEMHGGSISAASPGANQGSTFTVVLPRMAPRAEQRTADHLPPIGVRA